MTKYVPKRIPFQHTAFVCRTVLAALDHNVHSFRNVAVAKDGQQIFKRKYSKRTKRWTAVPVKVPKDYPHIPYLIARILKARVNDKGFISRPFQFLDNDPKQSHPTIAIGKRPPPTKELIAERKSRKI